MYIEFKDIKKRGLSLSFFNYDFESESQRSEAISASLRCCLNHDFESKSQLFGSDRLSVSCFNYDFESKSQL